jgi:hypothetical protein
MLHCWVDYRVYSPIDQSFGLREHFDRRIHGGSLDRADFRYVSINAYRRNDFCERGTAAMTERVQRPSVRRAGCR